MGRHRFSRAFTLVELMVSMVVLLILAMVVFSITSVTAKIWKNTNTKIDSFQNARAAFESLTRTLSQATLNTYWDYYKDSAGLVLSGSSGVIDHYGRNSELHFICGQASSLITSSTTISGASPAVRPTHAIFFVAPTGETTQPSSAADPDFQGLNKLLNAVGYYIEFNDDKRERPAFLSSTPGTLRYRYRLMQITQPAENLAIYNPTASSNAWFNVAIANGNARPIAENIIALIIQPKRSMADVPALAADYAYDSRTTNTSRLVQRHQLPPLVQITMVALDESSAVQIAAQSGTAAPSIIPAASFTNANGVTETANPDLDNLINYLNTHRYTYRVFTSNVLIKGAKWSED